MNYPIQPTSSAPNGLELPVDENALVDALKVVVLTARENGQTLAEITAEVLSDDQLLGAEQRLLLSEIVAQAWEQIPGEKTELATITPIASESRRDTSLLAG